MKKIYFVLVFFNVFQLAFGQSPITLSVGYYSGYCHLNGVITGKDDNIIVIGFYDVRPGIRTTLNINKAIFNLSGITGLFVAKLNKQKEVLWFKELPNLRDIRSDINSHVVTDDSSNVYLIGKLYNTVVFDEKNILNASTGDMFVAKYTSDGKLKWAKKYVGSSDDGAFKPKIDSQGNLYIIGKYQNSLEVEGKQILKATGQNPEPYILKLDRNGNYIWAKSFNENLGLNAISVNNKSEVFIVGDFKGSVPINGNILHSAGLQDIFYAKYDKNGQFLWVKTVAGKIEDTSYNIECDKLGSVYIAGIATDNAQFDNIKPDFKTTKGRRIFLAKIDNDKGNINWIRNINYDDDTSLFDTVKEIKLNADGEPYIMGSVANFITIEGKGRYEGSIANRLGYVVKYNTDGEFAYAIKNDNDYGAERGMWRSIDIDSKRNIYFTQYNIDGRAPFLSYLSYLHTYSELYEGSCVNEITIQSNNNIISTNLLINAETFNYQWYKNGESILNATQPTFPAKEVGYYSLKLINKTNNSCQISSSNTIAIYSQLAIPPLLLVYTLDKYLYTNDSFTTEWYKDNILIQNANLFHYYYTQDGTYKVRKYYDNSATFQESNEIVIKDGLVTTINKSIAYDDGDKCKPVPYLKAGFNNAELPENGSPYNLQWFLNGKEIKDSTKNHLKPITTGEYQVSVINPVDNKTYTSGKYKIVIEDFPKSLSINKIEDNCGASALLKVDDSFMQRYTFQSIVWRLDGNDIPNENYPYLKVNKSGFYTFSLKYLDNTNGATSTCNYNSFVTFDKKADFKLNVGYAYAGSGCVVDSFKVFVPFDKNYTYAWTKNDIPIRNQTSNELFVNDKSRYKGIVSRADGCKNEIDEISLKGCTPATSDKFLLLNPPLISAEKTSFYTNETSLLSSSACSNVNLQWLKDSQLILGANKATLEVKESGNYALQIEKLGCVASSNSIKISVETILGIGEKMPAFAFEVYPNPTEEKLFVSIPAEINGLITVKMTDILGRLINNYDFSINKNQFIDLKTLPDGVYFLSIEMKGKQVVKKIIKKS